MHQSGSKTLDLAPPLAERRSPISLRSVLLGVLAVIIICALPTYNDHVVVNTFFIGSYIPLALVLLVFLLLVLVNCPLRRLAPSQALTSGELAIILLMAMVGAGLASQGLFRLFIPMLIGPFHVGQANPRMWDAFVKSGLPDWLFPVDIANGKNNPIVNSFVGRLQPGESVPFLAWARPLSIWGIFILGWFMSLVAIVWIFRRQWSVNERLPFPIASIEASLIAEPRPGRLLNDLLGSRVFWIGLLVVFALQSLVALNGYFPKVVPAIPLSYNLGRVMANEPWVYFAWPVKSAKVYFTFIGMAYFIQSRISFSLWATFLVAQVALVNARSMQSDISPDAWRDQHVGSCIVYTIGFLWIGRHHIMAVLRQLAGRPGGTTLTNEENYRPALLIALAGIGIMMTWLLVVQVQWWIILLIVAMVLMSHLATARIVAETGMPYIRLDMTPNQIFSNLPTRAATGKDIFFTGMIYAIGPVATRESVAVFSQQGLVLADNAGADTRKLARSLLWIIALAFLVGFVVSASASLWTHYNYATPIARNVTKPYLDPNAMERSGTEVMEPMARNADRYYPAKAHSPAAHFSVGLGLTAILQFLSLRFGAWPFLPVGYLMCSTWAVQAAWFSLLLGWLAKILILKYGGASIYQKARPLFVGAIFGEALAAGVWMLLSLTLAAMGYDYRSVPMLPQ